MRSLRSCRTNVLQYGTELQCWALLWWYGMLLASVPDSENLR